MDIWRSRELSFLVKVKAIQKDGELEEKYHDITGKSIYSREMRKKYNPKVDYLKYCMYICTELTQLYDIRQDNH